MNVGDTVKYTQPENDTEAAQRFILIDVTDNRCIIEQICEMVFRPQLTVRIKDICIAND